MDNIRRISPGSVHHWVRQANGSYSENFVPSSSGVISRNQTGYKGPRHKPLIPNAYRIICQDFTCSVWGQDVYTNGMIESNSGPCLHPSDPYFTVDGYDWTPVSNSAIEALYDNARGSLDLSVAVAEAGQTAKMLKVSDQLVDYSRQFFKNRWGPLKALSSAHLAFTYGVKPLVSDIYGLADESIRVVLNEIERYQARDSKAFVPKSMVVNTCFGQRVFTNRTSFKMSNSLGMNLSTESFDPSRFTSLNPVSIAWELLPYSFVIDWVYNVGGYLRSLETSLLYANRFRNGYSTKLSVSSSLSADWIYDEAIPGGRRTGVWRFQGRHVDVNRSVLSGPPRPSLPSLDVNLGSSRLMSAAELLQQFIRR